MPLRSRSPGQGRASAKRLLTEVPGAAVPLRSRSPGQGRAGAKRSPIAEQGQLPSRRLLRPSRPPARGPNSGTELVLKLLQNRNFVIPGQNLRVFCYGLGDARSEPGMTGRRFRVKPGMTLKTPGMTGDARSEPGMTGRRFRVKPGMTLKTPGMTGDARSGRA